MEIENKIFDKLIHFISECKKNKKYEFEVRFWSNIVSKKKITISQENYTKIFNKLTFSKENNGLGLSYEIKNLLDVVMYNKNANADLENLRMTIDGMDDIKKYWLNSNLTDLNVSFMEKEKLDKIDDVNLNIRYSLNNEINKEDIFQKNIDLITSDKMDKLYRLKNRYSLKSEDNLFQIDLTAVKSNKGKTFKSSNTLKENPSYEVEIEFIGHDSDMSNEDIIKKLLYMINIVITTLQNNTVAIESGVGNSVIDSYFKLVNDYSKSKFIAANPVTIHRINLTQNTNVKNIYNRYAVTLKADGMRYFLYVYDNGKIYLINNNFEIIDTGFEDKSYKGTLIEGELVTIDNMQEFFMYDILFDKGVDVRHRHLYDIVKKDESKRSRLELIELFFRSDKRTIAHLFDEKKCVKISKKMYRWSVRPDGTDIFDKIKEIWESRKFSNFKDDGMILVPLFEYYPLNPGSWTSLFKWKPPQLNSIDFLIKTQKDDNGVDIKSPYIEVTVRPDGKRETKIRQYKTIKLFVGDTKVVYNNENNKMVKNKKRVAVEFNPYNMDEKNSEMYNLAKIFLNDDGKMVAHDINTNEDVEFGDDVIVEFGYDETREDGFKWIPIKLRIDKTNLYKAGHDVYGNSKYVADDIFKSIKNPVSEEMILSGKVPLENEGFELNVEDKHKYFAKLELNTQTGSVERFSYQNFHNRYIKYQLFYLASPAYLEELQRGTTGKILDLCCGKGVDINKIKDARYAEVVGMDISIDNIKFAQDFYKKRIAMPKPKAFYVRGDSGKLIWPNQDSGFTEYDKIYTKKFIPSKYYFDTISLHFCIHYLFESEIKLRSLLQNLNDNLKIGGFVIGTTFDGERIVELLKNKGVADGKTPSGETMWKIEKKFGGKISFGKTKANYGKQIDVLVKTIGVVHTEYLVNFNFLDHIMEEYGFAKVAVKPFADYHQELLDEKNIMNLQKRDLDKHIETAKEMTEDEKRFSFLSSGFMYKKVKNSPDSLFKKLVKLMESEDKKKGPVSEELEADIEYMEEL